MEYRAQELGKWLGDKNYPLIIRSTRSYQLMLAIEYKQVGGKNISVLLPNSESGNDLTSVRREVLAQVAGNIRYDLNMTECLSPAVISNGKVVAINFDLSNESGAEGDKAIEYDWLGQYVEDYPRLVRSLYNLGQALEKM
jgi:hypothetical protein